MGLLKGKTLVNTSTKATTLFVFYGRKKNTCLAKTF